MKEPELIKKRVLDIIKNLNKDTDHLYFVRANYDLGEFTKEYLIEKINSCTKIEFSMSSDTVCVGVDENGMLEYDAGPYNEINVIVDGLEFGMHVRRRKNG